MDALFNTFLGLKMDVGQRLSDKGLMFSQPKIIFYIYNHPGCQQKDVADNCFLQTATLSSVLRNLEERQFIKRMPDNEDKRAYKIYLTGEGGKYIDSITEQIRKTKVKAFEGFTEDELDQFFSFLTRIDNNLNKSNQ